MKHLKTYEALNFKFNKDDQDLQELLRKEEVYALDRRRLYTEYEEAFLEEMGFVFMEAYKWYVYDDAENYITFSKQTNNVAGFPCYICTVYDKKGQSTNQIDSFKYELNTANQDDRLDMLQEIMRKVYVSINLVKKQQERKLKKQGVKKEDIKKSIGPDDEEWWNLPTE